MSDRPPRAHGAPPARARVRATPEDFQVTEDLGFLPEQQGEHAFLYLEKRGLTTPELQQRLADLSGIPLVDISYCGLKDRNAVTRQWFSVRLAGRPEPDWSSLEADAAVRVLEVGRHPRKLRRGVHRANLFQLRLRDLTGEPENLEPRLSAIAAQGVPNYFGEQRFGRNGSTLLQARQWAGRGGRRVSRTRRGLYLSALRARLFNDLLAHRVEEGTWNRVLPGDVCLLHGSRSLFSCGDAVDADLEARCRAGDVHPGLPLWGRGKPLQGEVQWQRQLDWLGEEAENCRFLESAGLTLDWRRTRLWPDDFSWQFCDDGALLVRFSLGPGGYATAILAELVDYREGDGVGEQA